VANVKHPQDALGSAQGEMDSELAQVRAAVHARRRRLPRQETRWPGKYLVEGAPGRLWGACEVLDISILGAGLEFSGVIEGPDDLIGCRILVDVQTPVGASITLQIMGEIRYLNAGSRGGSRVGIEFGGLSETEKEILNVLEYMQAVW